MKKKQKTEENLLQKQIVQSNTIQNKVHFISEITYQCIIFIYLYMDIENSNESFRVS